MKEEIKYGSDISVQKQPVGADLPDKIAEDLKDWVWHHHAVHHPVYDYLETTAQVSDLKKFVHAERMESTYSSKLQALEQAVDFPSWSGFTRPRAGVEASSAEKIQPIYDNIYRRLLRDVSGLFSENENTLKNSLSVHAKVDHDIPSYGIRNGSSRGVVASVVEIVDLSQYQKFMRGCRRLGIMPSHSFGEIGSFASDNAIEKALLKALSCRSGPTVEMIRGIDFLLECRLNYYDRIFSEILWS